MQARETDEVFITELMVELALIVFDKGTDLFQSLQIPDGGGEEQAEHQVDRVGEALIAFLLVRNEVNHHIRLVVANGDAKILVEDDAQGYGGVGGAAPDFLHVRDAQNDEHPTLVVFVTRSK